MIKYKPIITSIIYHLIARSRANVKLCIKYTI